MALFCNAGAAAGETGLFHFSPHYELPRLFLHFAAFVLITTAPLRAGIQITEIMHHPSDAGGMPEAQYEFVEL